jgi:twitching motility two-component system response regulator PilH
MIKVLVIDDSPIQQRLAKIYLAQEEMETIHAKNGKEGIATAIDNTPDIIILDIEMPEMDGIETLKNLKMLEETKDIPVMMCSSLRDEEIVMECLAIGAAGYVCKPHGFRGFRDSVKSILPEIKIKTEEPA